MVFRRRYTKFEISISTDTAATAAEVWDWEGGPQKGHLRPFFKDVWPPSLINLSPIDYFFWGLIESHTNRAPHNTKACLINYIMQEVAKVEREIFMAAYASFWPPVKAVMAAKGV